MSGFFMFTCKICDKEFTDGQKQAGMLTRHIRSEHGLTKKEYVIETEYDGDPPKCACGLCEEEPNFARGSFSDYAVGHDSHEWQEKKYVEKYGQPTCEYCGEEVGFRRGDPKKYCSQKCCGKDVGGFTQDETQEKIKQVVREKYSVDNVSELDEVKQKISKSKEGVSPWDGVEDEEKIKEWKRKIGNTVSDLWENDNDFRNRVVQGVIKTTNKPENRKARSKRAKELHKQDEYIKKKTKALAKSLGKKEMSKPHKQLRESLDLEDRGFEPEQQVGRYVVDELNEDEMKIIEVFGDYVHANPERFDAEDEIKLPGNSYKAKDKWERDQKKIEWLEEQGYEVTVLWASDTEEQAREKI